MRYGEPLHSSAHLVINSAKGMFAKDGHKTPSSSTGSTILMRQSSCIWQVPQGIPLLVAGRFNHRKDGDLRFRDGYGTDARDSGHRTRRLQLLAYLAVRAKRYSLPISHLPNQSGILTNGSKRTALLIYYLLTKAYDALRSRASTAELERRRNSLQTGASPSKSAEGQ